MLLLRAKDVAKALSNRSQIPVDRDPELDDVLRIIRERLAAVDREFGPERDARWQDVETFAAPYALAFLYEIERLEGMLSQR